MPKDTAQALASTLIPRPITHVLHIPLGMVDPNESGARFLLNRAMFGLVHGAAAADVEPAYIGQGLVTAIPPVQPELSVFTLTRLPSGQSQGFTSTLADLPNRLATLKFDPEEAGPTWSPHPIFSIRQQLVEHMLLGAAEVVVGLWRLKRRTVDTQAEADAAAGGEG